MKRIQYVLMLVILLITCNAYGQLWKQYADSAKAYTDKKNISKAIEFNNSAREELKKDSSMTNSYAMICYDLANSFYNKRQYNEAEPLYLEAKQIWEKLLGKEHVNYANSCNNLANLYSRIAQYDKAVALGIEAMQIRGKVLGKENYDYASSCYNLAIIYFNMVQYEKAEPLYLSAKEAFGKSIGKEHLMYCNSSFNLGLMYYHMGQYQKAEVLLLEVSRIREKVLGKLDPAYASSSDLLGLIYSEMGMYEKAEALHGEAREIREKVLGKEHLDYIYSSNNLALLYKRLGRYEKAEALYIEAWQFRAKVLGKNHPEYAQSCNNLASLYSNMGQYDKAENLYIEARQIQEKVLGSLHIEYAFSCFNLGGLYGQKSQYTKAELFLTESKQIIEKVLGRENPDYALSCNTLASLYTNMGQYAKAEPLFLEAKLISEKGLGKENREYALSCHNFATYYFKIGQFAKAEPLFLEAKQIWEKQLGKQHPLYGQSCSEIANLYWLQGKAVAAEKAFKESFTVNIHNLVTVFEFINEKEKAEFIKNVSGEDEKAYSFYLLSNIASAQPYSLSLFHRNLVLSSLQSLNQYVFSNNDTVLNSLYTEWINQKKYLSTLYTNPGADQAHRARLEEQAGQLEKELNRRSSFLENRRDAQGLGWEAIQQNLKVGEVAIEFSEFRYYNGKRYTDSSYYVALLLRKDKPIPEMVYLYEKKQLDSLLLYKNTSASQHQLSYLYSNNQRRGKKSIYDIIWKPIEKKLAGIKTIYFAPAGALHKIAFSALPVSTTQVLSDKYQLVQLNTTASVGDKSLSSLKASDKIILYGGVQYDADSTSIRQAALNYSANDVASRSLPDDLLREGVSDFYYLTGTEKEVTAIENLARKSNYTITRSDAMLATEESFKNLTGKNSPSVLHVATHGFFFPDPKNEKKDDRMGGSILFKQSDNPLIRSGLALAGANNAWKGKPVSGVEDGILTAYEISNMYLPNTKLAVLSACETGLGDIQGSEGVYGLQRAFKMAGVQNLVMSLWKVPDIETAEFMEEFYKNLFDKQAISIAFLNAQSVMKNKYRNDPYKWAAWVLVR